MDNYNESSSVEGSELEEEYDNTFDGEERVQNFLKLTSNAFSHRIETINIKQIGFTEPIKQGRQHTMTGLTATIRDLGVLTPIHVMTVPEESEDDDYKYVLIDGLRRIFGASKGCILMSSDFSQQEPLFGAL